MCQSGMTHTLKRLFENNILANFLTDDDKLLDYSSPLQQHFVLNSVARSRTRICISLMVFYSFISEAEIVPLSRIDR